jgi:hypothetical protein
MSLVIMKMHIERLQAAEHGETDTAGGDTAIRAAVVDAPADKGALAVARIRLKVSRRRPHQCARPKSSGCDGGRL